MIKINLLKPEKKELKEMPAIPSVEIREKKKPAASNLIIFVLIVAVAALFFFQRRAINKEKSLLSKAEEEKSQLQYISVKLEKLKQQKSLFEKKINLITQLMSYQEAAVKIMDELSKNLPGWVWLTETTYENQIVKIKGNALSNNLIADYIFNLEKSAYFDNVNLISSTQRRERNDQFLEFSLTAIYTLPQAAPSSIEETEEKDKQ